MLSKNEAVNVLDLMVFDFTGCLAGLPKASPMADVIKQRIEAIVMAQEAIRLIEKMDTVVETLRGDDKRRGYHQVRE